MPRITNAPTPTQLANAWKDTFGEKVREHAGRDGRLSKVEARRMAERMDLGKLASDNAVNYIGTKTSVSVERFLTDTHAYVKAKGEEVAGGNGRISIVEARLLPPDLRADFRMMRGLDPEPVPPDPDALKAAVRTQVLHALDGETAERLSRAPASVRGRRPFIENIPHPATNTRATVWIANATVYISRASPDSGTGLVGWYKVGRLPV